MSLTEKTYEERDSKKIPIIMGSGKDDFIPIVEKDGEEGVSREFLEDGKVICGIIDL